MDLTSSGGMDGAETPGHLLRIDPAVRAIIASGYDSDGQTEKFRALGFRGILSKPYLTGDLGLVLQSVLGA